MSHEMIAVGYGHLRDSEAASVSQPHYLFTLPLRFVIVRFLIDSEQIVNDSIITVCYIFTQ